jgi:hypothetical protein
MATLNVSQIFNRTFIMDNEADIHAVASTVVAELKFASIANNRSRWREEFGVAHGSNQIVDYR